MFSQEEVKGEFEFDFFATVAQECHRFMTATKLAGDTIEQDLKDVQVRKAEFHELIGRLGKHERHLNHELQKLEGSFERLIAHLKSQEKNRTQTEQETKQNLC